MRAEHAKRTVDLDFDGYGIGGLSVGETREQMLPALAAAIEHLPNDRPRYLMGVGDPASLVEAIALGVDQFDCVMQTRLGRHGTALTSTRQAPAEERPRTPQRRADRRATAAVTSAPATAAGYLRHLLAGRRADRLPPGQHPQRGLDAAI